MLAGLAGATIPVELAAQDTPPAVAASARRIEADVRFLADDLLEGREAGTRGFELAAQYVASRYREMGLEPAGGDGTYLQAVPMLRGVRRPEGARFAIDRDGVTTELKFREDFLPSLTYDPPECSVTAPMVFVGQGVHAPEFGHDDYAGVDVRGKVAVLLSNAPARFPNDQRAYYSSSLHKSSELVRRGAVGVVSLSDPVAEDQRSWELGTANWERSGMRALDAQGKPLHTYPAIACSATVPVAQAGLLFAGSSYDAAGVYAMLERGELRAFELVGTVTLASRTQLERVTSHNVVGRLLPRGRAASGPLAGEHVVLTAHLDHVGIGAPVEGDSIYNGAQDNAVGVATMLEAGRLLAAEGRRLRRSVVLVATTAEEKGLLGAEYYATYPTVPRESIVANVNLDMPLHIAPVSDAIPYGLEHSTLDSVARRAVTAAGLTLTPDPMPEEVFFIRSDQYPFIRAGIPAVYLGAGIRFTDGTDGAAAQRQWMHDHYHLPSDDAGQPIDWVGAAQLAVVNKNIALAISTQPQRPAWKPGDFFGEMSGSAR